MYNYKTKLLIPKYFVRHSKYFHWERNILLIGNQLLKYVSLVSIETYDRLRTQQTDGIYPGD